MCLSSYSQSWDAMGKKNKKKEKFCPLKIIWWCVSHLMTWEMCSHSCVMADRMSVPTQLRWLGTGSYSGSHLLCILASNTARKVSDGKDFIDTWHPLFSLLFFGVFFFLHNLKFFECHSLSWGNICSKLTWLTHFFNNIPSLSVWKNFNEYVSKTVFCFFCSKELHGII